MPNIYVCVCVSVCVGGGGGMKEHLLHFVLVALRVDIGSNVALNK